MGFEGRGFDPGDQIPENGLDLPICKGVSQPVGIVALVGQERLRRGQACQQGRRPGVVRPEQHS